MQTEKVGEQPKEEIICTGKPYPVRMGELELFLRISAKKQKRSLSWVILNYCGKGLAADGFKVDDEN